jgi:hypothetical protein
MLNSYSAAIAANQNLKEGEELHIPSGMGFTGAKLAGKRASFGIIGSHGTHTTVGKNGITTISKTDGEGTRLVKGQATAAAAASNDAWQSDAEMWGNIRGSKAERDDLVRAVAESKRSAEEARAKQLANKGASHVNDRKRKAAASNVRVRVGAVGSAALSVPNANAKTIKLLKDHQGEIVSRTDPAQMEAHNQSALKQIADQKRAGVDITVGAVGFGTMTFPKRLNDSGSSAPAAAAASASDVPVNQMLVTCNSDSIKASFHVPVRDAKETIYALHRRLVGQFIERYSKDFDDGEKTSIRTRSSLFLVDQSSKKAQLVSKIYDGIPYWFNRQMVHFDITKHLLTLDTGKLFRGENDADVDAMPVPDKLREWITESKMDAVEDIVQFVVETHHVWISRQHIRFTQVSAKSGTSSASAAAASS